MFAQIVVWLVILICSSFSVHASPISNDKEEFVQLCTTKVAREQYINSLLGDGQNFLNSIMDAEDDTVYFALAKVLIPKRYKFTVDSKFRVALRERLHRMPSVSFYTKFLIVLDKTRPVKEDVCEFMSTFNDELPDLHDEKESLAYALILSPNRKFGANTESTDYLTYNCLLDTFGEEDACEQFTKLLLNDPATWNVKLVRSFMPKAALQDQRFRRAVERAIQSNSYHANMYTGLLKMLLQSPDNFVLIAIGIAESNAKYGIIEDLAKHGHSTLTASLEICLQNRHNRIANMMIVQHYRTEFVHLFPRRYDLANLHVKLYDSAEALEIYTLCRFGCFKEEEDREVVDLGVIQERKGQRAALTLLFEQKSLLAGMIESQKCDVNWLRRFKDIRMLGNYLAMLPDDLLQLVLLEAARDDFLSAFYVFPLVCRTWRELLPIEAILTIPKCAVYFGASVFTSGLQRVCAHVPWRHFIEDQKHAQSLYAQVTTNWKLAECNVNSNREQQQAASFAECVKDIGVKSGYLQFPFFFSNQQILHSLRILHQDMVLAKLSIPYGLKRHLLLTVFSDCVDCDLVEECIRPFQDTRSFLRLYVDCLQSLHNTEGWLDTYLNKTMKRLFETDDSLVDFLINEKDLLHEVAGRGLIQLIVRDRFLINEISFAKVYLTIIDACLIADCNHVQGRIRKVFDYLFTRMNDEQKRVFRSVVLRHILVSI